MNHSSEENRGASGSTREESGRRRPWGRLLAIAAASLLVVALAAPWALGRVGHWLMAADPLRPADVLFVHAGDIPYRAMEAAELYRDGLAPEVWLAPIVVTQSERALRDLGIDRPQGWHWNRLVLERLGVASDDIRLLDMRVLNTADELRAVAEALRERNLDSVILVSSKQHTRRIKMLWNRVADPELEAIVRPSESDPFDPEAWWTDTDSAQAVLHELAGMVNIWIGSPLRPAS